MRSTEKSSVLPESAGHSFPLIFILFQIGNFKTNVKYFGSLGSLLTSMLSLRGGISKFGETRNDMFPYTIPLHICTCLGYDCEI